MDTNNLKRLILTALCGSLIFSNVSFAQEDIISFYPKAYAKTQNPPEEKKLIVIAEQKMEDKYVTFLGVEKGKVLLAVITKEKIKNPQKSIYLKPRFKDKEIPVGGQTATLKGVVPDAGKITEWNYVFDRNGDGKIDYFASLMGAFPVTPKGMTSSDVSPEVQLFLAFAQLSKLIFAHFADDNLDEKVDGVVLETMDYERRSVVRWTAIKSLEFDNTLDTCWQFKDSIQVKERDCLRTQYGYVVRRADEKEMNFESEDLTKSSESLLLLNQAASLCGLTKDSFYKE